MLVLAAVLLTAGRGSAETFRLDGPDGTVHYTNAPTDPRYRRLGPATGTSAGWLRMPTRAGAPYDREITTAAARHGVPEKLVRAVIRVESAFDARAVSRKGARGLMQLMPATAAELGVRDAFDPRENIDAGVRHLRGLIDRFGDDLRLALAAYNAGERAVLTYGGLPPYRETRDYVARVLRLLGDDGAARRRPTVTYRIVAPDGTITYTNIPPPGRR